MSSTTLELLIVEDDPNTAVLVADVAEPLGWRIRTAVNGAEALNLIAQAPPHLIISDVMMPVMDGFTLLERLRRSGNQTPFIVMTAARGEESPLRAIQLGANDFLVKPFASIRDLRVVLNRHHVAIARDRLRDRARRSIFEQLTTLVLDNDHALVGPVVEILTAHLPPAEAFGIQLGLNELLTNAIEHGNLAITQQEKRRALETTGTAWSQLLDQRRHDHAYAHRQVHVVCRRTAEATEWTITDQGDGFDPATIPDPTLLENLDAPNGRGIFIARQQFAEFTYSNGGRTITVRHRHPDGERSRMKDEG